MANPSNSSAGTVLDELSYLLFSKTLTADSIQSDYYLQSTLAALLNSPAIIPSNHLARFLTSVLTLDNDVRSACTQFFAMDWFAFISRSACMPSTETSWSDSERTALAFVTHTMLQEDKVSAREVLLAVQQRLTQIRAQWIEAMEESGEEVEYESASESEDEDEAQGDEQVDEEAEKSLDRQAVFVLMCGLHAYYHAMTSPSAKKRTASLHADLLSAWLPLRALTSSPSCARLFLSSASDILSRLLALNDPNPQSFTLRVLGHFVGLLPASDPLVQHQIVNLQSLTSLLETLVPSVAIEDHVLVALMLPTATGPTTMTTDHFDSLLDTIGGLMVSPVTQHWHLAHSLLSHLATFAPPRSSLDAHAEHLTDFFTRHWLPFLSTHCTDPSVRSLIARAGNLLLSTHLSEKEQATLLAGLVHASPYANGKCMLIGSMLQPRVAANTGKGEWAGGWPWVRGALVPSMQRDVHALVEMLGGDPAQGDEVAGHMMVVLAWVQFAYVLVKSWGTSGGDEGKQVLREVVVGPLTRLDQRGMVPPVVGFAVGGLREALGDAE